MSGGHTQLTEVLAAGQYTVLGRTLDDAAGEAFDKIAKLLGLGYPGGHEIDRLAVHGNPLEYAFPMALMEKGNLDFSFSGLKTSVRYFLEKNPNLAASPKGMSDLCASVRHAIVGVLLEKTSRAVEALGLSRVAVSGGVAANNALREGLGELCRTKGWELYLPAPELSTDNAAMMAFAAVHHLIAGEQSPIWTEISPQWHVGEVREDTERRESRCFLLGRNTYSFAYAFCCCDRDSAERKRAHEVSLFPPLFRVTPYSNHARIRRRMG